jgi:hypothetical protein
VTGAVALAGLAWWHCQKQDCGKKKKWVGFWAIFKFLRLGKLNFNFISLYIGVCLYKINILIIKLNKFDLLKIF